jgi:hypothetical protein
MRLNAERQQAWEIIGRTFDRANAARFYCGYVLSLEVLNAAASKFQCVAFAPRDGVAITLALNPTVLAPQLARPELPCRPHGKTIHRSQRRWQCRRIKF